MSAATSPSKIDKLVERAVDLSDRATSSLADFDRSTAKLYKILVEVLLLWIECRNEPGALDALYADLRYKKPEDGAPTLVPFLRVIFKKSKIAAKEHARFTNWNIALLCLYYEYLEHPTRYRAKPAPKLVDFIRKSGGLDGLLTDQAQKMNDRDEGLEINEVEFNPFREGNIAKTRALALTNVTSGPPIAEITPIQPIRVGEDNLSALLARRMPDGSLQILGSTNRRDAVGLVAQHIVRRSTSRLEDELKPIVDAIRTQAFPPEAMPVALLPREKWLNDVYRDQTRFFARDIPGRLEKKKNEFLLSFKKLLIDGTAKSLLLSSARLRASVVTKCSNVRTSLAVGDRFCMPGRDILLFERMLETGEINAISVVGQQALRPIPLGNTLQYSLHLKRPTPQLVKIISLYDAARDGSLPSAFQSDFDFCSWTPSWSFSVGQQWFAEVREMFLDRWFATLGANKQIKRLNNQAFELSIGRTLLKLGFNMSEAGSPPPFEIPIALQQSASSSAFYLSKDLGPVLYNLADMDISGDITISGNVNALVATFSNETGNFQVAVPTAYMAKDRYQRIEKAFHERRYG